MKGRPETQIENPNYVADMTEILANLDDSQLAALTDPLTGLQTVCRYLPTPADVFGFLRDAKARKEAVRPAPTSWKRIEDDPEAPWNAETDVARKRAVVRKFLGHDPDAKPDRRTFTPPNAGDFAKLELQTPPKPVSEALKQLLARQGYPLPTKQTDAA